MVNCTTHRKCKTFWIFFCFSFDGYVVGVREQNKTRYAEVFYDDFSYFYGVGMWLSTIFYGCEIIYSLSYKSGIWY